MNTKNEKIIIFPFYTNENNQAAYCQVIQLAEKENASILFLTTLPADKYEEHLNTPYLHLLALHGYYQTLTNQWNNKTSANTRCIVGKGELLTYLQKIVAEQQPDWIISQADSPKLQRAAILKLLPLDTNCRSKIL